MRHTCTGKENTRFLLFQPICQISHPDFCLLVFIIKDDFGRITESKAMVNFVLKTKSLWHTSGMFEVEDRWLSLVRHSFNQGGEVPEAPAFGVGGEPSNQLCRELKRASAVRRNALQLVRQQPSAVPVLQRSCKLRDVRGGVRNPTFGDEELPGAMPVPQVRSLQ